MCGLIVLLFFRVTVVKSTTTRRSKGIAFVLFLKPKDAVACAAAINNTQVNYLLKILIWNELDQDLICNLKNCTQEIRKI